MTAGSVAGDDRPAGGQVRLESESRGEVIGDQRPGKDSPDRAARVAPDGIGQGAGAGGGCTVEKSPRRGIARRSGPGRSGPGCPGPGRRLGTLLDHEHPALAGQTLGGRLVDHVGPGQLVECGFDGGAQAGLDVELLVEPAPAAALGRPGDPALLILADPGVDRREAGRLGREGRAARGGPVLGGSPAGIVLGRRSPRGLAVRGDRSGGRGCALERPLGARQPALELRAPSADLGRGRLFGLEAPDEVGQAATCGLGLRLTSGLGSTQRGRLLTPCPGRGSQRRQLAVRLGQEPFGLGNRRVQVVVAWRDRDREAAPLDREGRVGGLALSPESRPVTTDRLEVAGQARLAEPELGDEAARGLVGSQVLAFRGRARAHLGRDRRRRLFRGLEVGHRPVRLGPLSRNPSRGACGHSGRLVPTHVGRSEERRRQLLPGREPRGLLLGLGGEPAGLGSKLGEDVLDPGKVRLGLGELILGLAPAPLVATDPGHLLEQRAALFRPEGEGLVDHPLADEQERVVGKVGAVEQVDEVAQTDPLLVQEVVVLAAPVQPAAELEDAEVDRKQTVGVVEDEGHIGHAEGLALLRAGEDHVLGLAAAQGPALLAERPAEGVGEVALARPVRPDDRADPRPELHDRPLGERLEPLEAEREQTGGRTHRRCSAAGSLAIPEAGPAAAVPAATPAAGRSP